MDRDTATCCICLENYSTQKVFKPEDCNDIVCQSCLATYLNTQLDIPQESYDRIACPRQSCTGTFDAISIVPLALTSPNSAHYWWRKVIENTIMDSVVSVIYCFYSIHNNTIISNYRVIVLILIVMHRLSCFQKWMTRMTIMYMQNASIVPEAYVSVVKHLGIGVSIPSHSLPIFDILTHTYTHCLLYITGVTCKDNQEDNRGPSWKRPGGEKRRRRRERENSIQARQLAKRHSWTRCPFCKQMVEKKVKVVLDWYGDFSSYVFINSKDVTLLRALVNENCKYDVINKCTRG